MTMFPFIIPGSVLGIAFVFAFNKSPIILTGTVLIMIISFAVRRMPYTVRSSTAIWEISVPASKKRPFPWVPPT